MKIKTSIKDLIILKGRSFKDRRGWLREGFKKKLIKKDIIFSIISKSNKNVIRGLHLQTRIQQDKLVTVLKGKILDVVVDLRRSSKTFGKHHKVILSEKNCKSMFVPKGFAHGFLSLEKENIVLYGCSNYRDKKSEASIKWNDPDLKINWGIKRPILSKKDEKASSLKKFLKDNK